MVKRWMQGALTALVAVVLWAATTGASHAIIIDLNIDHCTGGCGTMPAGTVTLIQNGTGVDVTVHLNNNNQFVQTGAGDDQAFKFNGVGVALGDIIVGAHVPGPLQANTGTFNGDGGGTFAFGISCPSCGTGGGNAFSGDILFHVNNATIADLTGPLNDKGQNFVADIISGQTGNTGLVGAPGPIVGAGIPGLIAGCAMLIGLARRRRKLASSPA